MKTKLELNREQLSELFAMLNKTIEQMMNNGMQSTQGKMVCSILTEVVIPKIGRKLLSPSKIKNIGLKVFESESIHLAIQQFEMSTSDPYQIAIIEQIKSKIRA